MEDSEEESAGSEAEVAAAIRAKSRCVSFPTEGRPFPIQAEQLHRTQMPFIWENIKHKQHTSACQRNKSGDIFSSAGAQAPSEGLKP